MASFHKVSETVKPLESLDEKRSINTVREFQAVRHHCECFSLISGSYSEICLSAEDDLNDDLLPGEIHDLNLVQDTTEEITKMVEKINQG